MAALRGRFLRSKSCIMESGSTGCTSVSLRFLQLVGGGSLLLATLRVGEFIGRYLGRVLGFRVDFTYAVLKVHAQLLQCSAKDQRHRSR